MVKRDIARHTVIVKRFYFNEVWVLVFETMTTPAVLASGSPLVFGGCQGFVPIKPGNCITQTPTMVQWWRRGWGKQSNLH